MRLVTILGVGVLLAACSSKNETVELKPDPSSSTATSSGQGGAGGGSPAGGAGGMSAGAAYESGSRLRARWLNGADGSRAFAGWHDSQRDVDCQPMTAWDEKKRCLPSTFSAANIFEDAACTYHVAVFAKGSCPSAYASMSLPESSCGQSKWKVVKIGGPYTYAMYQLSAGSCTLVDSTYFNTLYDSYHATEVAPEQWVEMTETVE